MDRPFTLFAVLFAMECFHSLMLLKCHRTIGIAVARPFPRRNLCRWRARPGELSTHFLCASFDGISGRIRSGMRCGWKGRSEQRLLFSSRRPIHILWGISQGCLHHSLSLHSFPFRSFPVHLGTPILWALMWVRCTAIVVQRPFMRSKPRFTSRWWWWSLLAAHVTKPGGSAFKRRISPMRLLQVPHPFCLGGLTAGPHRCALPTQVLRVFLVLKGSESVAMLPPELWRFENAFPHAFSHSIS
jgi:hypothetical protein